jgi:hypothetical protein
VLAPIVARGTNVSVQHAVFEVVQTRGVLFARHLTTPPPAGVLAVVPALAALVGRLIVVVAQSHTALADMPIGCTPST